MNITVRLAVPDDLGWLVSSQITMARESEGMKLDESTCRAGIEALIRDPSLGRYFIAETEAGAGARNRVGCVLLQREWSDWRNGWVGWIHSVFVEPSFRGKHVWASLYEWLKVDSARDPGFRGFRLYVDRGNHGARAVYQKLGMTCDHYEWYEWMK